MYSINNSFVTKDNKHVNYDELVNKLNSFDKIQNENKEMKSLIEELIFAIHFNDPSQPHPMDETLVKAKKLLNQLNERK